MLTWKGPLGHCTALCAVVAFSLVSAGSSQTAGPAVCVKRVVAMEYPSLARMAFLQGNVELVAEISRDGKVEGIRVASGPEPLAVPAKETLSKWRFSGCGSGRDECELRIMFSFVLSGTCSVASQCTTEFAADLPDRVQVKSKTYDSVIP